MTVYADILFIVNMYVDAMLLYGTARFMQLPLKKSRWLAASLLGGVLGGSMLGATIVFTVPVAMGILSKEISLTSSEKLPSSIFIRFLYEEALNISKEVI